MTAVQILRTLATAVIIGGGVMGLIPNGSCGSGWLLGSAGPGCGVAMAPVSAWALGLIAIGLVVHVGVWINTPYQPKDNRRPQVK